MPPTFSLPNPLVNKPAHYLQRPLAPVAHSANLSGQFFAGPINLFPNRPPSAPKPSNQPNFTDSLNLINSFLMIRGPDDGKVSVERTKVEGVRAHLVLRSPHPCLMNSRRVIEHTLRFLETGVF